MSIDNGDSTMPTPPSEKEITCYYSGIPSKPRLVARSSTEAWAPKHVINGGWSYYVKKCLMNVGDHPIIDPWNAGGPIRDQVIEAVKPLACVAIDILRFGYEKDSMLPEVHLERPVTLLVTVLPGSTTWDVAHPITVKCKEILESFGISDVHCEVKEGRVYSTAIRRLTPDDLSARPTLTSSLSRKFEKENAEGITASLAPLSDDLGQGTKGLYVRVIDPDGEVQTALLTCRHVVDCDYALDRNDYRHDGGSGRPVVQPGLPSLLSIINGWNKEITVLSIAKREVTERIDRELRAPTTVEQVQLTSWDKRIANAELERNKALDLREPQSRVIGHVLFTPPCDVWGTSPMDWALIQLNPVKHTSPLSSLKNQIHLRGPPETDAFDQLGLKAPHDMEGPIPLVGMIPEAEINRRSEPLVVAKWGAKSGLTFGVSNEVRSIYSLSMGGPWTEQWCIVGIGRPFTSFGDSGAWVWEAPSVAIYDNRRLGGMVTSCCGDESASATTYATTLERLTSHASSCGYQLSLVGE